MGKYLVFDRETENHAHRRRFASPFYDKNWTVLLGWKKEGDTKASWHRAESKSDEIPLPITDDVDVLVGHNIKFDLLHGWDEKPLKKFFKRGGKVWCTQYAEYLIRGMQQKYHMASLNDLAKKYGGTQKIDEIKILWNKGVLTSQIEPSLLLDYLVGTTEEGRDAGDIGNTEKVYLSQIKIAEELNMLPMIWARMDGLCATTEMEYRGLKIDVKEAKRKTEILEKRLDELDHELIQYLPDMPPELEFNWGSVQHRSALIFGGAIKYSKVAKYKDDSGEYARKRVVQQWPLFNGEPVNPDHCTLSKGCFEHFGKKQDTYVSGKKKGAYKFKNVTTLGELKTKRQTFMFKFKGYTTPQEDWKLKQKDVLGNPFYQTSDEIIQALGNRDIPFLKLISERQSILKDLGTYYIKYDEDKGYVGMLTAVHAGSNIIHHNLNHTSTVTGRLSSSNPNMQNIPKEGTSEVKKMFISRFEDGVMLEIDYSQLEVVVQGMLTGDKNLCEDLRNKLDFHCKRVASKFGITYEEALFRCKDASYPEHALWKRHRNGVKEFSFQRAYGAGAAAIALSTGMSIDDVKILIEKEDEMYPGVGIFNNDVLQEVERSSKLFKDFARGGRMFRRGKWQCPTGTIYSWRSYDAPSYLQKKGIKDSFMPTELKNYPIQGTGGEVVQIVLGKLWRHFVANDNYNDTIYLCNTVHDCVWFDVSPRAPTKTAYKEIKDIMEAIPRYLKELYGMKVTVPFPVELEVGRNLYDKKVIHI